MLKLFVVPRVNPTSSKGTGIISPGAFCFNQENVAFGYTFFLTFFFFFKHFYKSFVLLFLHEMWMEKAILGSAVS